MSKVGSRVTVSAPGSIMITGEHAVVYGHRAIVAAIDQRIEVTLKLGSDGRLRIKSEIAEPLECAIDALPMDGPYKFVLAAVAMHKADLVGGCDLDIRSDIDPNLGLGSSAAVTIAVLGAISQFIDMPTDRLHGNALKIVRKLQGRGSGADLAASLHGGLIAYRAPGADDRAAEIAPVPLPKTAISLKYCGYKTPTGEILRLIAERRVGREAEFDELYARMGRVAEETIAAAETEAPLFYDKLREYQGLMVELGVSDETLDRIVDEANASPQTLAAKISGSGLGDCVVAFGDLPKGFEAVDVAKEGLMVLG